MALQRAVRERESLRPLRAPRWTRRGILVNVHNLFAKTQQW